MCVLQDVRRIVKKETEQLKVRDPVELKVPVKKGLSRKLSYSYTEFSWLSQELKMSYSSI